MIVETINNAICDDPEILWSALDLEGEINNEHANIACPIHNSSNSHSLSIYFNNYGEIRGRWKCHTKNCQNVFKNSIIGFTRGILSNRHCNWKKSGDKIYGWNNTINYLKGLYNIDGALKIDPKIIEKKNFIRNCFCIEDEKEESYICTLESYLRHYTSPSQYFRKRGFSDKVLEKYYVRNCDRPNSKFYRRSIVPVLDETNRFLIGISCRSTCNQEPKWLNSDNFPASTSLYNYNNASEFIRRNRTAIITESPGCVWKLYEAGIYNTVGIWGATGWNDYKKYLLDKLGVMKLVLALDNDEAGRLGTAKIKKDVERIYNTVDIVLPSEFNDIGEMQIDTIKDLFYRRT